MEQHFVLAAAGEAPQLSVAGLVLAGKANIKNQVAGSPDLAAALRAGLLGLVDVQHNGVAGLAEACERAAPMFEAAAHRDEAEALAEFDRRLAEPGNAMVCYGERETRAALASGAVELLLLGADAAEGPNTNVVGNHAQVQAEPRPADGPDVGAAAAADPARWQTVGEWAETTVTEYGGRLQLIASRTARGAEFGANYCWAGLLRWPFVFDEDAWAQEQEQAAAARPHAALTIEVKDAEGAADGASSGSQEVPVEVEVDVDVEVEAGVADRRDAVTRPPRRDGPVVLEIKCADFAVGQRRQAAEEPSEPQDQAAQRDVDFASWEQRLELNPTAAPFVPSWLPAGQW